MKRSQDIGYARTTTILTVTHFLSPVELKRAVITRDTGAITTTLNLNSVPVSEDESL